MEETIVPNMTKSKFDCYLDTFDVKKSNPLPNETDQILPVTSDVEQNSRFDLSRTRDLRDDVSPRECDQLVAPSVPPSVPAIEYLPSPEEDANIKKLQKEVDESKVIRPKELGQNLSIPQVKHNKTKNKKPKEKVKEQPTKTKEKLESDYHPSKYSIPQHEVLPKNLRSRKVPGFPPKLSNIQEESDLSHNNHVPSSEVIDDHVDEPYHINENTIAKLERDLNKVKLVLKRDPNTKNWVSYDMIKKFPEASEEDE